MCKVKKVKVKGEGIAKEGYREEENETNNLGERIKRTGNVEGKCRNLYNY